MYVHMQAGHQTEGCTFTKQNTQTKRYLLSKAMDDGMAHLAHLYGYGNICSGCYGLFAACIFQLKSTETSVQEQFINVSNHSNMIRS